MLELLFWGVVVIIVLSIGSAIIDPDRTPAWVFYPIVVPVVLFLLWKVGALEWLFNV